MKKIIHILLALVMIAVLFVQMRAPVFAAGTTMAGATQVASDGQINYGTIFNSGAADWYYVTTGECQEYYYFTLHNESGTSDMKLSVYTPRSEEVFQMGRYLDAGEEETGNVKLYANTNYYFKIQFNGRGTGNYYFKIHKNPDFIGDYKDTATVINVNQTVESSIDGSGDKDFYFFNTGEVEQEYSVTINNISGTGYSYLQIYSARDEKLLDIGGYTDAGESDSAIVTLNPNSSYYAIVSFNGDETGNYSFNISQCINGHTKGQKWETIKEPTCTENGEKAKLCQVCKAVLQTKKIKKTGHTANEWKSLEKATWLSLGEKEAICDNCGETVVKKDWSKAWILPAVILGSTVLLIGIINYAKSFGRFR